MIEELKKMGADIQQIGKNKYLVIDNGFFGFCEEQDPFVIDEEELEEIYNEYK